jgi:ABC-type uncharacterized transport system substrate-binding protein
MASYIARRKFLATLGGAAAAWPLAAGAQQGERMRRIGVLMGIADDAEGRTRVRAFKQELHRRGWIIGGNLRIDERWSAGDTSSIKIHAAELVGAYPDVMFVYGGRTVLFLRAETRTTIPVVFVGSVDPVGEGIITSWAHPSGNITGFVLFESSIIGKLLQLLREIAPKVVRVALIFHPDNSFRTGFEPAFEAAARALGVAPVVMPFRDAAELQNAIDGFAHEPNGGLIVPPDIPAIVHRDLIISLTNRHHLPAVYAYRTFGSAGGLACYGADITDLHRRAADYVDRILRGEKAADLPVQTPTKYELVINLITAKALGLDVPLHLQQLADEVIE